MSRANPTPLRIGMSGILHGRRYTVRGRVVLSMVADDGETYYWNEFDLVDASGTTATLVFEEMEDGPTWKWFTLLEPRRPLSVVEAAGKSVGDTIEFEGRQIPITLVDQSRVEFIEGLAPEGVEVGDLANYFNADAGGGRLFVASWTGDEIEFYLGRDLGRRQVDAAFGIRTPGAGASFGAGGASWGDWGPPLKWITWLGILAIYVGVRVGGDYEREGQPAPAPEMKAAPATQLPKAAKAELAGRHYEIVAHAEPQVFLKNSRFREHEYWLRDSAGGDALLAHGWGADPVLWVLLQRVEPAPVLSAYEAAALRRGAIINVGGRAFVVTDLFLTRVPRIDGPSAGSPWPSAELHGVVAQHGDQWLYCRWTERELAVFAGPRLPVHQVRAAFAAK